MNIFKKIFGASGPKTGLFYIVEDNPTYAKTLESFLKVNIPGTNEIKTFPVGETCLPELNKNPDLIIMDYFLDTKYYDAETGTEIIKEIRKQKADTNIIILTSHENTGAVKDAVDNYKCTVTSHIMRSRQKLLYGLYFLMWTVFLITIYSYQTDNFYELTQYLAPVLTYLTLTVSILALIFNLVLLILKKQNFRTFTKHLFYCSTPFLFVIPLLYHYNQLDTLEETSQTIELRHIAWACDCADWATKDDYKNFSDNINDTLAKLSIYIEPARPDLRLPDSFYVAGNKIKFTGKFYKFKKFPKHYFSYEQPGRARVFKYEKYTVVRPFYVMTQLHPDSFPTPVELK